MKLHSRLLIVLFIFASSVALADPSTAVTTQTVHTQKLIDTVTAYGQLVPTPGGIEWLSAARTGRISAVLVTQGARVAKGQSLVRIASTPQTQAAYRSAQADLAVAMEKLKQTQVLEKNGLATRFDLAAAQGFVVSAQARLAALKAEGVGAHAQTLKASMAGVITQLAVSRGEWVNAGTRIAALAPRGSLWVRLGLTPAQAAAVKPQARVKLVPVFGPGKLLVSHVARVDAQANATTGLIDAEVPLPVSPSGPFAGEWVGGTITLRSVKLPTVARLAVLKDAHGYYLFVVRKGVVHRVYVKPVIRAHGVVGLVGVEPGVVVVIQGNFELRDGDRVRIVQAKDFGS